MKIPKWMHRPLEKLAKAFVLCIPLLCFLFFVSCCQPEAQLKDKAIVSDTLEQHVAKEAKQYESIAIKKLSKTDCGKSKATMRELYGVKDFVVILGNKKRKFDAVYYYVSERGVEKFTNKSTWYQPRRNPNAKTVNNEWRLYYGTNNPVMEKSQPGDIMLVARLGENSIEIRIFDKTYKNINADLVDYDIQINTSDDDIRDETVAEKSEQEFVFLANEFEESNFRSFRNKQTKHKWIFGNVTKITDGDTWKIDDIVTIRSAGIDSPESRQKCLNAQNIEYPCGTVATEHASKLLNGKQVYCELFGSGKFGRILGICYNTNGTNINQQMVRDGHAVVSTYEPILFEKEEMLARKEKLGVWQGKLQHPHCFRHKAKKNWKVVGLCENNKFYDKWDNKYITKE